MEEAQGVWSTIENGGVGALLFFALVVVLMAGIKQWWVFGWTYRESQQRETLWKSKYEQVMEMLKSEQDAHREHYLLVHSRERN